MQNKLRLLYAEDNPDTARETAEELEEYGFEVNTVYDGDEAWMAFQETNPDLVLLDYRMPGKNGLEVFSLIHRMNPNIPVLILSSYTEYCIASLKNGTADFIRKDALIEEVALRLKMAWKQSRNLPLTEKLPDTQEIYYLSENCRYNAGNTTLFINEQPIQLTTVPGELLTVLCQNQNHYVSKQTLCKRIWNVYNSGKTTSLRNYISDLRKMLEGADTIEIRSSYGKGYCLKTLSMI